MTGSGPGGAVRVLVVDDQLVVREGLSLLLGLLEGVEVIGTAIDGADAVRQVERSRPDVVLMDLKMPTMDGVEATGRIVAMDQPSAVVVLTTYLDDDWVFRALQAGARGFLTKDADPAEIRAALLTVVAGQARLDPSVQRRLLDTFAAGAPVAVSARGSAGASTAATDQDGALTGREEEVLIEIAHGYSNPEIAERLFVSEATVKTHVNHLLAKTGSRDRAALVGYAYRTKRVRP